MTRARCLFSPVLAASLLFIASAAHALPDCSTAGITVAAGFTVKRCWTASALGVDRPIGGLRFNDAGTMLYVVGDAGTSTSKIHMVPVTRGGGPGTQVTDLLTQMGTPVAATSPSSTSGLDAGLEIGPTPSGTTAFVTYFGLDNEEAVTTIGERPGGISGPETKFTLRNSPTNLFQSPTGLTFSPFRTDPGTGLGHMQVSTSLGMIWEIGLTPSATPGIFNPGAKQLFVSVLPGGMEAIQYVPAGQFLGDLMYATRDDATVRRVEIDPATGLPLNTQGEPQQGTDTPLDFLFATGFSAGPIGLEFDAKTSDDLFVTTFDDAGSQTENKIYQIGGFSLGTLPTTTFTTTTVTTTTSTSTVTTVTTTITTTTSITISSSTTATSSTATTTTVITTSSTTTISSSTTTAPPTTTTSSTTATIQSTTTVTATTSTTTATQPTTTSITVTTTTVTTTSTTTTPPTTTTVTSATSTTTPSTTTSTTTQLPTTTTATTSSTTTTAPPTTTTATSATSTTTPSTTTSTTTPSTTTIQTPTTTTTATTSSTTTTTKPPTTTTSTTATTQPTTTTTAATVTTTSVTLPTTTSITLPATTSSTTSTSSTSTTAPTATTVTTSTTVTSTTRAPTTTTATTPSTTSTTGAPTTTTIATQPTTTTSASTPPTTSTSSTSTTTKPSTTTIPTASTTTSSSLAASTSTSTSTATTRPSTTTQALPLPTTTSTMPPISCEVAGPEACIDEDACTIDNCVTGSCVHTPRTGFDSVTCTCSQPEILACHDQPIPHVVSKLSRRACGLFFQAGASGPRRAKRKLLEAAGRLKKERRLAARAGKRGVISPECSAALVERIVETEERARQLALVL